MAVSGGSDGVDGRMDGCALRERKRDLLVSLYKRALLFKRGASSNVMQIEARPSGKELGYLWTHR